MQLVSSWKRFQNATLFLLPCEDPMRRWLWTKKWALIRNWICWHLELALPSLQNYKFLLFTSHLVYGIVIAAWTDQGTNIFPEVNTQFFLSHQKKQHRDKYFCLFCSFLCPQCTGNIVTSPLPHTQCWKNSTFLSHFSFSFSLILYWNVYLLFGPTQQSFTDLGAAP